MNDATARPTNPKGEVGKFTTGSIMRHVIVMSASGAIGLIAIFAVDLLSLLYISWLGNINFTAGVGYATAVMFFSTSANVGLMIGLAALVSRSLGAGDRERARRLAGSASVTSVIASALIAAFIMAVLHPLLTVMGAVGDTHDVAYRFLMIAMPSNVLLGWGMSLSGILRSVGDAKRSMFVTLSGGIASVFIDPILIFGLGLGTDGAAIATIISRLVFCAMGYYGTVRVHNLVKQPDRKSVV
jgi:Na+-driven multidrug efflux pump